jgi:hypothetical protein
VAAVCVCVRPSVCTLYTEQTECESVCSAAPLAYAATHTQRMPYAVRKRMTDAVRLQAECAV